MDPVEQTVDAGNAAIFNCSVAGHPIKKLSWYKNGEPLANDTHIRIQPENKLVVRDVRRHDQGMYQCFIGNDRETVQGAAQLSLGGGLRRFCCGMNKNIMSKSTRCGEIRVRGVNIVLGCVMSVW